MKYLAYVLIIVFHFDSTMNQESYSINSYNNISNNIFTNIEYSLPKSLKTSKEALSMIKIIKTEFKEIVYLIDMPMILKSLKNGKKHIELFNELVILSEKAGYEEGIIKDLFNDRISQFSVGTI